jgi:hypothetical protein
MSPNELAYFARQNLESLIPWLVRHDLAADPIPEDVVNPTEFVLAPVGAIKCALGLGVCPAGRPKASRFRVGIEFTPLFVPAVHVYSAALRQGRAWSSEWTLSVGHEGETAEAIARALERQWPGPMEQLGSVQGVVRSLQYDAYQDADMLELLGYSHFILGDVEASLGSLGATTSFDMAEEGRARLSLMQELIRTNPQAAMDQLATWRAERLRELDLWTLAGPWPLAGS